MRIKYKLAYVQILNEPLDRILYEVQYLVTYGSRFIGRISRRGWSDWELRFGWNNVEYRTVSGITEIIDHPIYYTIKGKTKDSTVTQWLKVLENPEWANVRFYY